MNVGVKYLTAEFFRAEATVVGNIQKSEVDNFLEKTIFFIRGFFGTISFFLGKSHFWEKVIFWES